jgi:hypothetical protein
MALNEHNREEGARDALYAEPVADRSGLITGVILAAVLALGVLAWMNYDTAPNLQSAQNEQPANPAPPPAN